MTDPMTETPDPFILRQRALARWDNEGGAGPEGPQKNDRSSEAIDEPLTLLLAELEQLHGRVIALENLIIALLASSSEEPRALARGLAAKISPRPGSTQHTLTTHAARQMLNMVERAEQAMMNEPAIRQGVLMAA